MNNKGVQYLLDQGTLGSLRAAKNFTEALLDYHWKFYWELALQRKKIEGKLKTVLIESSKSNYNFEGLQRAVKLKYSDHPFSTVGSIRDPAGGRFNVGDINPQHFPKFPALYLACDKDTALQETLGQIEQNNPDLSPQEIALTNPQSLTIVSVSGSLEKVFDLRSARKLSKFVNLIKKFKLSPALRETAKKLNLRAPRTVKKPVELHLELLQPDWRLLPMHCDVPSGSQIFGQLVYFSGIEGILYPSKLTGKDCLAIFPHNFKNSVSCIHFDDEPPNKRVPTRVDFKNWEICDLTPDEFLRLNK